MVGCCKKIEMIEEVFEKFYEDNGINMDTIDVCTEIEKILELWIKKINYDPKERTWYDDQQR